MATPADPRFAALVEALGGEAGVSLGSGRRGFGSDALHVDGHIFAMVTDGRLVLKLPTARVATIIGNGDGFPFDAGKGRPMKEWVALADHDRVRWRELALEALAFVGRRERLPSS